MSIIKSGDQVESQGESFAAIAIWAAEDAETLEPIDNVLRHQSLTRQLLVVLLLLWGEWVMFALLVRRARILMLFLNPCVTAVTQTRGFFLKRQLALLEQGEIMGSAIIKSRRQ